MSAGVVVPIRPRPDAWAVFAEALTTRRPVRARYHGTSRLLCPHVLGWKNGRAKVLSYQVQEACAAASAGPPVQRWRLMFIDEMEETAISDEPWETADNYTGGATGIDIAELAIEVPAGD